MTKYSYILIGDPRGQQISENYKEDCLDHSGDSIPSTKPMLSGLYLWVEAFKKHGRSGTIEPLWDAVDLERYDIIHINYTPSNIQLPSIIREQLDSLKNSSTQLVMNVDLDVSRWGANWSYNFHNLFREMNLADHVFHVESVGANILKTALDREVHVNPHPVDVSNIFDLVKEEREPVIATMYHRYNAETMIPFLSQKDLGLPRVLYGYTPGKHQYVANAGMFHQIINYTTFYEHLVSLSDCAYGCDLYDGYTFGRSVIEFAALGIPAVVSNTIEAAHRLYPLTMVDPIDIQGARDKFIQLMTDVEFLNEVIIHANQNCGYYNLENSYDRFVEMVEGDKNYSE